MAAPTQSGILRAIGSLIDYVVAEPLHFAMVRKMMLGLKQRAENSLHPDRAGVAFWNWC